MFAGIIYKYTSPSKKVYIGQTINEKKRRQSFLNLNESYAGAKIDNARHKYSPSNFKYEVVETVIKDSLEELKEELDRLEIYYIGYYDSFHNGYNLTIGGDKGNLGYKHTEYSKHLMSLLRAGKKLSEEHRKHLGEAHKGLKRSVTTKVKMSKAIYLIDPSNGLIINEFFGAREAEKLTGIDHSSIIKCCKGKILLCKGYKWKYKN